MRERVDIQSEDFRCVSCLYAVSLWLPCIPSNDAEVSTSNYQDCPSILGVSYRVWIESQDGKWKVCFPSTIKQLWRYTRLGAVIKGCVTNLWESFRVVLSFFSHAIVILSIFFFHPTLGHSFRRTQNLHTFQQFSKVSCHCPQSSLWYCPIHIFLSLLEYNTAHASVLGYHLIHGFSEKDHPSKGGDKRYQVIYIKSSQEAQLSFFRFDWSVLLFLK